MILKFESYFEKPDVETIRDILNIAKDEGLLIYDYPGMRVNVGAHKIRIDRYPNDIRFPRGGKKVNPIMSSSKFYRLILNIIERLSAEEIKVSDPSISTQVHKHTSETSLKSFQFRKDSDITRFSFNIPNIGEQIYQ